MKVFTIIFLSAIWVGFSTAFTVNSNRPFTPSTSCYASSSSSDASTAATKDTTTPVHLLAGFLGSGKTTTLKHLLENTDNVKIGVVVNDVASVNIDAKLVSKDTGGIVELQNGCACCSLQSEFVDSIETLLGTNDFEAIVVELSGVADPIAVKNTWREAVRTGHAVATKASLKNVVTVVDACTFGTDYLTWDVARDRPGWTEEQDDCSGNRKVTELLAEQVEAADIIVVNKLDLADKGQVTVASKMATSLNDKAILVETTMGKVSPETILRVKDSGNEEEDEVCNDPDCTDNSHSHSHDHECGSDESHSHSHDHDHGCSDPDCTDASHSHDHNHDNSCSDPDCTDTSHSHTHDHACNDPTCTDTSHSHSHDHATSTDALGISNFVYKATRPFDAMKIQKLLLQWPIPIKNVLELETLVHNDDETSDDSEKSPFEGVLRSKGFCWFAPTSWDGLLADPWRHETAMYWSHAGKHMGIQEAGRWWSSVDEKIMKDFFADNPSEFQRIRSEDFVTEEFGDRRQELVFIGVDLDQQKITKALDDCLLSEKSMEEYRENLSKIQEITIDS